jgi:hypothetical protein
MSNILEFHCGSRKLSVRPIPNQPGFIGFIDDRVVSIAAYRWQALRGVILTALHGKKSKLLSVVESGMAKRRKSPAIDPLMRALKAHGGELDAKGHAIPAKLKRPKGAPRSSKKALRDLARRLAKPSA